MWSTRKGYFPKVLPYDHRWSLAVFSKAKPKSINKLQPLQEVGPRVYRHGQSSNTLSGWEAQRVKLASFLGKGGTKSGDHILFYLRRTLRRASTFHDYQKLLHSINALEIDQGTFRWLSSSTILRWSNPQIGWWLGTRRRKEVDHLPLPELPRTWQRAGELTGKYLKGEFRVIRTTLQGFQIPWRVLLSQWRKSST